MMTLLAQTLVSSLAPLLPDYLEELTQLCAIEAPTDNKPGVDKAGRWVRDWVARYGWEVSDWRDEEVADSLVITLPGLAENGKRIMLVAHLDTVYPVGTAASTAPL